MRKVSTYICEKCGKKFDNEQDAINCERCHPEVVNVEYQYALGGITEYVDNKYIFYPDYIVVTYSDGKRYGYRNDRTW